MLLNNLGFKFLNLAQNNLMLYIGQIILSEKKKVSENACTCFMYMPDC